MGFGGTEVGCSCAGPHMCPPGRALPHPLCSRHSVSGSGGRGFPLTAESGPCHPSGQGALRSLPGFSLQAAQAVLGFARGHKPRSPLQPGTEKLADSGAGLATGSSEWCWRARALHPPSHQEPVRKLRVSGAHPFLPPGLRRASFFRSVGLPPPAPGHLWPSFSLVLGHRWFHPHQPWKVSASLSAEAPRWRVAQGPWSLAPPNRPHPPQGQRLGCAAFPTIHLQNFPSCAETLAPLPQPLAPPTHLLSLNPALGTSQK